MKKFKSFLKENPSLIYGGEPIRPPTSSSSSESPTLEEYIKNLRIPFKENEFDQTHVSLGNIHDDYELHHIIHKQTPETEKEYKKYNVFGSTNHTFAVVHKDTGQVIGKISTNQSNNPKSHFGFSSIPLIVDETVIHPKHRGKSLAKLAYKHIVNNGHILMSGSIQSRSGANIWRNLMKEPNLKERMFVVRRNGRRSPIRKNANLWSEPGAKQKNSDRFAMTPPIE